MADIRSLTLETSGTVLTLLRDPQLRRAWSAGSALPRFSVGGLAGHLAAQVFQVEQVLVEPPGTGPLLTPVEHYGRAAWIGAGLDAPVNVGVREAGERLAEGGPDELAKAVAASLGRLRERLPAEPADRIVTIAWTGWRLTLDDFLLTRLVEMAVHTDDLAVSAPVAAPGVPDAATDLVLALLARVAAHRHGRLAVLRAFSRADRAGGPVTAL
ncbi:maleylpyruvate isomerase N-terminal domain-containing protein [Streptomyces sp. NPDC060035]|uniref:maleylpyruvate isomerase N-terminal domain-containing protein n=1 Tax=Streptomyces sp. NPDC060035 TaxID=3347044 RepID=UPI0036BE64E5